ncbi:MAG TPA: HAD family hydrolase [Jiangellaceae bacterium]
MSIDAVIFDWGGTLTPWHDVDLAEKWLAYAEVVQTANPAPLVEALVAAEATAWAAARDRHESATFDDVLAAAEVAYNAEAAAAYRASFDRHTYTDADVPALFTDLRERDVRVGVLSNTMWPRDWHRDLFARDGVLELIDGDVYSSEIPHTKPHELAFRKAMAAVGADDPSRCVFVGDRPYDDISGARAIGMRTIFVPHSNIPAAQQVPVDVSPDAVVERLAEVVVHVDGWRNGGG